MKEIIERIKNKEASEFDLQELVKFLAENLEKITLGEEMIAKEYIRKGALQLKVDMKDIQDAYQSFRIRRGAK